MIIPNIWVYGTMKYHKSHRNPIGTMKIQNAAPQLGPIAVDHRDQRAKTLRRDGKSQPMSNKNTWHPKIVMIYFSIFMGTTVYIYIYIYTYICWSDSFGRNTQEHAGTCSAFAIQVALQTFLRKDEMDIVVASNNWAKTSPNGLITIVFRKGLDENLQQHQAFRKTGGMAMPKLYECSLLHFSNICKSIYYHILYHTISMHDVLWNWNLHAEIAYKASHRAKSHLLP